MSQSPVPVPGFTVAGGTLFTTDGDGALRAFALDGGRKLWQVRIPDAERGADLDGLVVAGGVVIVTDKHSAVHAYGAADGTERWTFTSADQVVETAFAGGLLHVTDRNRGLRSLDPATGRVVRTLGRGDALTVPGLVAVAGGC